MSPPGTPVCGFVMNAGGGYLLLSAVSCPCGAIHERVEVLPRFDAASEAVDKLRRGERVSVALHCPSRKRTAILSLALPEASRS